MEEEELQGVISTGIEVGGLPVRHMPGKGKQTREA